MYKHTPLRDILNEDEAGRIGSFVTIETRRQGDGPYDVGFMLQAWMAAIHDKENGIPLSLDMIVSWAKMIDPETNEGMKRFRTGPIWIGFDRKTAANIEGRMLTWLEIVNTDTSWFIPSHHTGDGPTPNEWAYKAFEDIHPFFDGNGRTGKIIFNWLEDTLRDPKWPYNFWGVENL